MNRKIISGIYAVTGTGKTSLALTADNVLLVDFDCGAHRVPLKLRSGKEGLSNDKVVIPIKTYEDFTRFRSDLAAGKFSKFKTIAIDTINKLQDLLADKKISDHNKKNPERPVRALLEVGAYGKGAREVKEECKSFALSLLGVDKHIIYLSQAVEREKKDIRNRNETYNCIEPDLKDSLYGVFFDSCDFVASVSKNNKGERIINLTNTEATIIKGERAFYSDDGTLKDIVIPNVAKSLNDPSSLPPRFFQEEIIDVFYQRQMDEQKLIDDAYAQLILCENILNDCESQDHLDNACNVFKEFSDSGGWLLSNRQAITRKMMDLVKQKGFKIPNSE